MASADPTSADVNTHANERDEQRMAGLPVSGQREPRRTRSPSPLAKGLASKAFPRTPNILLVAFWGPGRE
jgi:hypothetical protein